MKTKYFLFHIGILALLVTAIPFSSCKKSNEPTPSDTMTTTPPITTPSFSFIGLTADTTVIPIGGKAKITANATGSNLTYSWSVNSNSTIMGSGSQVQLHITCPSCASKPNVVTCIAKDAENNSATKTITITVK